MMFNDGLVSIKKQQWSGLFKQVKIKVDAIIMYVAYFKQFFVFCLRFDTVASVTSKRAVEWLKGLYELVQVAFV